MGKAQRGVIGKTKKRLLTCVSKRPNFLYKFYFERKKRKGRTMSTEVNPKWKWCIKIKEDLEKALETARISFKTPGVIIGFEEDNSKKTGYLIRLNNGDVGVYPIHILGKKELQTGIKIKSNLPNPKNVVQEPSQNIFTFEVLREQIKLLPRMWLNRSIISLAKGEDIDCTNSFNSWVLLPPNKKKDLTLIKLLKMAVEYEGLRGLARFNDYASS